MYIFFRILFYTWYKIYFLADFKDFLLVNLRSELKSAMIGAEINTEEYVPTKIPINKAKANPLMLAPPNINSINTTIIVVNEVIIVRDNVELMASLMISLDGF